MCSFLEDIMLRLCHYKPQACFHHGTGVCNHKMSPMGQHFETSFKVCFQKYFSVVFKSFTLFERQEAVAQRISRCMELHPKRMDFTKQYQMASCILSRSPIYCRKTVRSYWASNLVQNIWDLTPKQRSWILLTRIIQYFPVPCVQLSPQCTKYLLEALQYWTFLLTFFLHLSVVLLDAPVPLPVTL